MERCALRDGDCGVPLLLLPSSSALTLLPPPSSPSSSLSPVPEEMDVAVRGEPLQVSGMGDLELSEEGMTGLVQTTLIIELMALPDNSSEDDSADAAVSGG